MTSTDASLRYIESEPRRAPDRTAPLLITFHGYGSHMGDLHELRHLLDDRLHVVSAQAPIDLGPSGMPGGWAWFDLLFTPGEGIGYDEPSATRAVEQADAFVAQTMQRLGTEPDQLYLLGFSQGSMIAHALLLRGSIIPAGVAACSGRLVDEVFAAPPDRDRLRDRRLFVSHGRFDDVIPVQCGQDIRDWYQPTGIDLEYHEYDMAHGLDQSCMQDLTTWFSKTIDG
jgi:phospholipase/carboxylesterase